MTRTTELLKGCGTKRYEGHYKCRKDNLCPECESELKGRLDVLKDEENKLAIIQTHLNYLGTQLNYLIVSRGIKLKEIPLNLDKELASIREEIKLIETAGIGK